MNKVIDSLLAFEMQNITKRFSSVMANDNVSFKCKKGQITALVGENGAGKTTLMNVLYGLQLPENGIILLDNNLVKISNPGDAIKLGIGMVHQHFMLSPESNVLNNIILGYEPRNWIFTDRKQARNQVKRLMDEYNFELPFDTQIKNLPVGLRQRVEILKLLYRRANILILDEPTAVLTPQETKELFVNLRNLIKLGKTIIFITHKLDEVMAISEEVYVMRNGRMVANRITAETNVKEIAEMMVGRELIAEWHKKDIPSKDTILEVKDLVVNDERGFTAVQSLDLIVNKGEILGIAGVSGNGQSEFAKSLVGLRKIANGTIKFKNEDITGYSRRQIQNIGISYIPDDRTEVGLCLNWSIMDNLIAGKHLKPPISQGKFKLLNQKIIALTAKKLQSQFDIRLSNLNDPVSSLSGGNQQKVVLAREIQEVPKILIAFEPTRGIDVGAIEFIYNKLLDLRAKGTAILLISSDLDEILTLSDRVGVIYRGKILAIVNPKTASREDIGLLMAGNTTELDRMK